MSAPSPIFRFAPTPNGRLHLGHAYSALCNTEWARRTCGKLLLRIEDIDPLRCKREFEDAIYQDMAWLGIEFEGAIRRQSEHITEYDAALASLQARGLVYPCFCTRGEIALANPARDPDGAPLHAGGCVAVSPRQREARLAAGEPAAIRLDMALALRLAPQNLSWRESAEGIEEMRIEAAPKLWGDVVLRGKQRPAAYHLAVVVDDALQGVSDVVRGRDLFPSTSVHRLLQALLGLEAPVYRHHRLVLDAAGERMSKSASSPPLAALRASGISAGDVRAALGFEQCATERLRVVFS
jgi:glutamyl-Q tRNA(Asp) synthetase